MTESTYLGEFNRLVTHPNGLQNELFRMAQERGVESGQEDAWAHAYFAGILSQAFGYFAAYHIVSAKELYDLASLRNKPGESAKDMINNFHGFRLGAEALGGGPALLAQLVTRDYDNGTLRKRQPGDGDDTPPNEPIPNEEDVPKDEDVPGDEPPDEEDERDGDSEGTPPVPTDPLVLDLDGDGIELIASDAVAAPYFDMDNDGFLERTGWVGSDDALLVRDIGGDGRITSVAELFGDESGAVGFAALAELDSNNDNALTSADAEFGELRIWRDLDGDAIVDGGELQTLSAAGIASISLSTTTQSLSVAGNTVVGSADITFNSGATRTLSSVLFNVDQIDAIEHDAEDVAWVTTLLPHIRGYGEMPSLWRAADDDPTLYDMVEELTLAPLEDSVTFREQVEAIVLRWTGMDGVLTNSRGYGDARVTEAVETFTGGQAAPWRSDGILTKQDYEGVLASWNDFTAKVGIRLLLQGPLAWEFLPISYDRFSNHVAIMGDVNDTVEALTEALAVEVSPATTTEVMQEAVAYWQFVIRMVDVVVPESELATRPYDSVLNAVLETNNVPFDAATLRGREVSTSSTGTDQDEIVAGGSDSDTLQGGDGSDLLAGGSNNDTLSGDDGDDTYLGGLGNDTLTDSWGADTYLYAEGDGADLIQDYSSGLWTDTLSFGAGITWAGVTLSRSGGSLVIDAGGGDSVIIQNQFSADHRIEVVKFADGTTKTWQQIQERLLAEAQTAGNDTITGFDTDDTFDGGAGNDRVIDSWGADTYLVSTGDGADRINDYSGAGWTDTVAFGAGITWAGLSLSRSGDTLSMGLGGGDSLTIEGQFTADRRIESFTFEGGTTKTWLDVQTRLLAEAQTAGNDTITGFDTNDTFINGAGNDRFVDNWGADSYAYALGNGVDRIDDSGSISDPDSVTFGTGITWAGSTWARSGNDLVISFTGGGSLTIEGQFGSAADRIENFVFDGGVTKTWWDVQLRLAQAGGTSGNDTITGFNTNDTLAGGAGNDTLSDPWGAEVYLFAAGDGNDIIYEGGGGGADTLSFGAGIDWNTIGLGRVGANLAITYGSGDKVTVVNNFQHVDKQIEVLRFADGTTKTWQQIQERLLAEAQTAGNDTIVGFNTNDTFDGGAGNDTVTDSWGADVYLAAAGDGNDRIVEGGGGGSDTLSFGADINWSNIGVSRVGWDLAITYGSGDKITVANNFWHADLRMEVFKFEDGTTKTWVDVQQRLLDEAQTAGNDTINGFNTNDTFDGGAGNDTVIDSWGADVYLAAAGDGNDRIIEWGGGGADTLSFGAGIDWNNIGVSRAGSDLVITYGSGDRISVYDHFWHADRRIDVLKFTDGTTKTVADIEARAKIVNGTAAGETIAGHSWNDTLFGGGGNDLLQGWDGNDTLSGGLGDDSLQGGNGADLFAYAPGDGNDVITDFNYAAGDRVDLTGISYIGNGANASIALLSADGGTTTYTISASNGYNWTGNEFV